MSSARKAIAKQRREAPCKRHTADASSTRDGSSRTDGKPIFRLACHFDGKDAMTQHATARDAAQHAWDWAQREQFALFSDWYVRHREHGWQDAYDAMVHVEGVAWDEESTWIAYVEQALTDHRKFEAHGEGLHSKAARIHCEHSRAPMRPFWHRSRLQSGHRGIGASDEW
jgi:hypothetical protein